MARTASLAVELRSGFTGQLLEPDDVGYEEARKLWNGLIDRRPALIARCTTEDDVAAAVNFGRERDLLIAVKGGGHNVTGNAMCDGGLVIDFSLMRHAEVDVGQRLVRVEAGALLGDVDAATQVYGLATPTGFNSTTGIAGLTLGGGIGHLMRKHGLTIDNLVAAEVVTAAGERVRASEGQNPDLFWGLRGGGGNFGVVTSFTFRLHEVGPQLLSGLILYRAEKAREVLRFYQDFVDGAPEELGTILNLRHAPPAPFIPQELHGKPIVGVIACYCGPIDDGDRVLRPLREFGPADAYLVEPRDFVDFQAMFNATVPHGWSYYWKSHYLTPLGEAAIDVIASHAWAMRSPRSYSLAAHLGGAVARVADDATAFTGRDAAYAISSVGAWTPEQGEVANDTSWVRGFFEAIEPYSTGGVYINFVGNEGQDRVRSAYGDAKYKQLAELKEKWDPENLFRLNQNIEPAHSS